MIQFNWVATEEVALREQRRHRFSANDKKDLQTIRSS